MHNYAIFNHNRATIGRWLGFVSIMIGGGISQLASVIANKTGEHAFSKGAITVGAIYFIIHFLFNRLIWKLPLFGIPNLNGSWKVIGKTLNDEGEIRFNWDAELEIKQTWENISIDISTKKSVSGSYTCTLFKHHNHWTLSYSYKNEPRLEQSHELHSHKGFPDYH